MDGYLKANLVYDTTAFLYEATAAFEDPAGTCDDIHDLLLRCGLQPSGMLGDFGSGTGLMSVLLAERGWRIYGIELSTAMLAVAQEKKSSLPPTVQERLQWVQGDITDFEIPAELRLDGAVCLCNTINHLAEPERLANFALAAYQALKPGGVLILDSDTLSTFLRFFHHGPVTVWDDGAHRLTRECAFNSSTGLADHTAVLERQEDNAWHRFSEERMTLRYYPETELCSAFLDAGFRLEEVEPYNPNPKLYAGDFIAKVLWIFRKPQ
jgi:SAM-dependent methyltransferase